MKDIQKAELHARQEEDTKSIANGKEREVEIGIRVSSTEG